MRTIFPLLKIFKGTQFCKNVDRVMVLVLCTLSDDALYLYQVSWKYLKGFKSFFERTGFPIFKFSKGNNSIKMEELWSLLSVHRLMMLYISRKFNEKSQRVFALLSGHEIMTDRRTDRQPDGQGDYYRASG